MRLPNDYQIKESNGSNYFKITEEQQAFRILTSPIIGYEYFRVDGEGKIKPVRQREEFKGVPSDSKDGNNPKEFWAFCVRNHNLKKVQIMEITQKTIMKAIVELTKSEDREDPKTYDLNISRTGKGTDTRYSLTPLPKNRFENDEEFENAKNEAKSIRLEALYEGDDPFKPF